jgi:hypothetical protein
MQFSHDFVPSHDIVPEAVLKGNDSHYLPFEDLPTSAKIEALLVIIVSSCLNLTASAYNRLIQDIFARLVFHGRASVCPFVVTRKGDQSQLSTDAAAHLHGRSLSTLMGVPEEAFVRFVVVTDFLRYHFDVINALAKKYRHLIGTDNYTQIAALTKSYKGNKATKPEKGFRNSDILFFQEMKDTVKSERRSMTSEALQKQFLFHYPGSSMKVKEEGALTDEKSRKRKETQDGLSESKRKDYELIAMPLDDDDEFLDYKTALIKRHHV